jgi:hypothetical protein
MAAAFNTQPWNTGIGIETLNLFVEGHQREDIVDSLFDGQVGVLKWVRRGTRRRLDR